MMAPPCGREVVGSPGATRPTARSRSTTTIAGAICTSISRKACKHLNGEQTVACMRFRHDWCRNPCRDQCGNRRSHARHRCQVEGDPREHAHAHGDGGRLRKYVQTDFTNSELLSLANYYQGLSPASIISDQVPYTSDVDLPGYGDSLVPDTARRDALVAKMLMPPPVPMASPDAMALAAIPASTLRVDVENGSGVSGAARRVANLLKHDGFTIGQVTDAESLRLQRDGDSRTFGGDVCRGAGACRLAGAVARSDGRARYPVARFAGSNGDRANPQRRNGNRRHRRGQEHARIAGSFIGVKWRPI